MTSSLRSLTLTFYFFGAFAFFASATRGLRCVKCASDDPSDSCEKIRPSQINDCEAGEKCFTASYKDQPGIYKRGCLKTDMKSGCQDKTSPKGPVKYCYCNKNICNSFGDGDDGDGGGSGGGLKCYHCISSDCVKPKLKECPAPFGLISKFLCMKTTQNGKDFVRGCMPDLGQGVQCVKGRGGDQTCLCNTDGCNNDSFGGGSRLGGFSLLWALLATMTPLFLICLGMDSFFAG